MTAIVAIKRDNIVYMGADSRSTTSSMVKKTYTNSINHKIQIACGDVLIAATGLLACCQIAYGHPEWFDFSRKKGLTKEWLVTKYVPRLKEKFTEIGKIKHEDGSFEMEIELLIAWRDKCFEICDNLSVIEYDNWQALGSGATWMLYDLNHMDKDGNVHEDIVKALRAATDNEAGVGAPYILIDTKNLVYESVEE